MPKTSALHAWDLSLRMVDGQQWDPVSPSTPLQRDKVTSVVCEAPVSDRRWVTNSSGIARAPVHNQHEPSNWFQPLADRIEPCQS